VTLAPLLLACVTAERLAELRLARRNTLRLLKRGASEVGAGHYPVVVALHAAWLAGLWLSAWGRPLQWGWLGAFVLIEGMRVWVLASLRERWTTRIIVLPGAPLVRRGPYRLLAHPNYAVVAAEIGVLPLVFGLARYALIFTILNALVLAVRIRCEDAALGRRRAARSPW
jgi:methyltransferase